MERGIATQKFRLNTKGLPINHHKTMDLPSLFFTEVFVPGSGDPRLGSVKGLRKEAGTSRSRVQRGIKYQLLIFPDAHGRTDHSQTLQSTAGLLTLSAIYKTIMNFMVLGYRIGVSLPMHVSIEETPCPLLLSFSLSLCSLCL